MAYTQHFWTDGEQITSNALNNIHSGIDECIERLDGQSSAYAQYEKIGNKINSLSASSTTTQYPSAKAVYDLVNNSFPDAMQRTY